MNVLVSAFECNPYKGSDSYVGWAYVTNMAKLNQVYVLTREANKVDIEKFFSENEMVQSSNLHFSYVKQSKLFTTYLYKINRYLGFLGSYYIWQYSAYKVAKAICKKKKIQVCHHVSIADFRCAGYLWKLKIPFIFGPVGGGQETPTALKMYIQGHEKGELFRSFMNTVTTITPNYRKALGKAILVYSSNDETTEVLSRRLRNGDKEKLVQLTELCIDESYLDSRASVKRNDNDTVHIIVAGRLIYRKGIQLLIDALPFIHAKKPYVLDVFGEGNQLNLLISRVKELGLQNNVVFHGKVDFNEMQKYYAESDIYVLPSLRESTGTAVFEAMANKLPVVTLNQNGAKYIVEDDAGILIDINSQEQILSDMGKALSLLIDDYDLRSRLGNNGYEKLKKYYTWSARAKQMNEVYQNVSKRSNL